MKMNDFILVSVDDHLVEPPDMFDNHIPTKLSEIRQPGRYHTV